MDLAPDTPPKKKVKLIYKQKFKDEYAKLYSVTKSTQGVYYAFCTVCSVDISIEHGGQNDVRRHIKTGRLKQRAASNSISIGSYFSKEDDNSVINAELLFTSFVVEHNLPLSVADHAGPLFRKMFPGSAIAQKYGCGRLYR